MISCFRDWCERNAPIFDFVSKMLLGVAGLFIAVQAFRISSTQVEIQRGQLEIQTGQLDIQKRQAEIQAAQVEIQKTQARAQLAQHIPNLIARLDLRKGSEKKDRIDDLIITNDGGDIFSPHFDEFVFWMPRELATERVDQEGKVILPTDLRAALIPLDGYFPRISYTSSMTKGELLRVPGQSLKRWDSAVAEFVTHSRVEDKSLVGIVRIFVRARYSDKFGQAYEQYIEVSGAGQRQIPDNVGRELVQLHKFGTPGVKRIYVNSVTSEILADNWDAAANNEVWRKHYAP